jgi:hypothetical protein
VQLNSSSSESLGFSTEDCFPNRDERHATTVVKPLVPCPARRCNFSAILRSLPVDRFWLIGAAYHRPGAAAGSPAHEPLVNDCESHHEPTLEAIDHWLTARASIASAEEPALIVNTAQFKRGQRLTGQGLYHVIRDLGRNAGVVARPHGLRHASITAALDTSNGDVRAAQAHARHANPQTTMRYGDNRQDLAGHVAAKLADALFNS